MSLYYFFLLMKYNLTYSSEGIFVCAYYQGLTSHSSRKTTRQVDFTTSRSEQDL